MDRHFRQNRSIGSYSLLLHPTQVFGDLTLRVSVFHETVVMKKECAQDESENTRNTAWILIVNITVYELTVLLGARLALPWNACLAWALELLHSRPRRNTWS